jgi:hypothetical protein
MAKAYIIVYHHQCLPTRKNDLKASNTIATIYSNLDVITLLKLVQSLCCLYDAKTQGVMATMASHNRLFTHYQKDGVNNHTYHHEFLARVETLETYGEVDVVGVVPTFLVSKIKKITSTGAIAMPQTLPMPNVPLPFFLFVTNIWLHSSSVECIRAFWGASHRSQESIWLQ